MILEFFPNLNDSVNCPETLLSTAPEGLKSNLLEPIGIDFSTSPVSSVEKPDSLQGVYMLLEHNS